MRTLLAADEHARRERYNFDSENLASVLDFGRGLARFAVCLGFALAAGISQADAHSASQRLDLDVRARIPGRCGFSQAPSEPTQTFRVDQAQNFSVPFVLDCNEPFVISVTSARGAVARLDPRVENGFRGARQYSIQVEVDTDRGRRLSEVCASSDLLSAASSSCDFSRGAPHGGWSSEDAVSINRTSQLLISWPDQSDGPRFEAGEYRDVITITVGRQP